MKHNYNEILDIIQTLILDKVILDNIIISGSSAAYIMLNKEPSYFLDDFYILVNSDKINVIRKKLKKLSKIYMFDIVFDCKNMTGKDHGFNIVYEGICVGFYPCLDKNNDFIIRTFSVDESQEKIYIKTKIIPDINRYKIIKQAEFDKKNIWVLIPEFTLAEKELCGISNENSVVLKQLSDENVVYEIKRRLEMAKISMMNKKIVKNNWFVTILLSIIFVILIAVAYICFKK